VDAIERIEIVRGPSSALYGADAVGGVVNIITKKPAEAKTTLSGAMGGQGYTSTSLYNTGRENNAYYSLSLGKDRSHGYRTNSDTDQVTAGIKVGYDFNAASSIEAVSDYTTKDIGVPGSVQFPTAHARQQDRLSITGLRYKDRLSQSFDFSARVYESEEFLGYQDPDAAVNSRSRVKTAGAEVQGNWLMGSWNAITIGAEGRDDRLAGSDAGTHSATVSAAYIQDELSLGDSFILVLGERNDRHSIYGGKSSPKASGRYLFGGSGTILRASYGESFRAPTFNDLFFVDSYGDHGNPHLKPERASEYEGGIEQPLGKGNALKFTAFKRKVRDLIVWMPDPLSPFYPFAYEPFNIGRAVITGTETELRFTASTILSGTLNYTRLFPVNDATGERLFSSDTNIPAMKFGGTLLAALDSNTSLSLSGQRVKNYVRPGQEKWDYYTVDGKITDRIIDQKSFKADVFLGMKNMFNRKYEVVKGYPMPPQQLYGGVTAQF
ncbi:MAG TPA: TonB-dependent receptor, partial [Nitrospirota bacterium]